LLIRPDDPVVRVNLGIALAADGDLNAATAEFLKALELNPGLVEAKLALAKALARGQRFDEADRLYREVLKQQPNILAPGRTRATDAPKPIPPKSAP
jgi:Flp pilus assembly protein TadD